MRGALLNQMFEPTRPNEAWVTDITYVHTGEGWLYVAGVKDVFTPVSWSAMRWASA
jgi:putative transposase